MENWHFSQVFFYFLFLQIFLSDPEKPKTTLKSLSIIFLNFLTNPAKELLFSRQPPQIRTYREQGLPELEISLRRLGDPDRPGDEHDEGPTSERESRGQPWERVSVQDLLVVDVEHHV